MALWPHTMQWFTLNGCLEILALGQRNYSDTEMTMTKWQYVQIIKMLMKGWADIKNGLNYSMTTCGKSAVLTIYYQMSFHYHTIKIS